MLRRDTEQEGNVNIDCVPRAVVVSMTEVGVPQPVQQGGVSLNLSLGRVRE